MGERDSPGTRIQHVLYAEEPAVAVVGVGGRGEHDSPVPKIPYA